MFKRMRDLEPLTYFDPCLYIFVAMAKKECRTCPLCEDTIDKIIERIQLRCRSKFISHCSTHSMIVSLRLSLEEAFKDEVRFEKSHYPISEVIHERTTNGYYKNSLFTDKTFNHFYGASVSPALYIKMILADCARFSLKT